MEISEQEYLELKQTVAELKQKIEDAERPKIFKMADYVTETPFEYVKNTADDVPCFEPISSLGNAWKAFCSLAKLIHVKNANFYMSNTCYGRPYIRNSESLSVCPKKLNDLTPEQQQVSIEMLNEMIPIWNTFFKRIHKTVMFDSTGRGTYRTIEVIYRNDYEKDGCVECENLEPLEGS